MEWAEYQDILKTQLELDGWPRGQFNRHDEAIMQNCYLEFRTIAEAIGDLWATKRGRHYGAAKSGIGAGAAVRGDEGHSGPGVWA